MATIDDRRSEEDKKQTALFVVATDKFMSGWGHAPGRSLFAVPCRTYEQAKIVSENMTARGDMKYIRLAWVPYRPKLRRGDHLSIRAMDDCSRFYEPHGFCERS